MRESGFYWISFDGDWYVAQYYQDSKTWELTGSNTEWLDADFTNIDERQIKRL